MAWLYVPESAASSLGCASPSETPTAAWATSSGKPSPQPPSWHGWKTRPWIARLSGTISRPSMADRGVAEWISSLPVSPASHGVSPGSAQEPTTTDGSGPTSPACFATFSPGSSSSRTSQGSLLEESSRYSATWPCWGSMRNGACSARRKPERRIGANGCSSWPTAVGEDAESSGSRRPGDRTLTDTAVRNWPTATVTGNHNRKGLSEASGDGLVTAARNWPTPTRGDAESGQANHGFNAQRGGGDSRLRVTAAQMWPTPTAAEGNRGSDTLFHGEGSPTLGGAVRAWATPTSRDWKDGYDPSEKAPTNSLLGRQAPRTATAGDESSTARRSLNPRFVEWLMGFPPGWTASAPLGTASCLWWQLMRSELSRLNS